ncbi:MAG: hypothetical protein ACE5OY_01295 [Candidatus Bathyarchaeia archaeon]
MSAAKGIKSLEYLIFTFLSGISAAILGTLLAYPNLHLDRFILVLIGVFTLQAVVAHGIHDLYHGGHRKTYSKRVLKILIAGGLILIAIIGAYLTYSSGWLVLLFAGAGIALSFYAKGLLYIEEMFPTAGALVVLGSYYVQASTLSFQVAVLALCSFFWWYGGIHIYRLDDYGWSQKEKTKGLVLFFIGVLILAVAIPFI